jgi:hypothetical protein
VRSLPVLLCPPDSLAGVVTPGRTVVTLHIILFVFTLLLLGSYVLFMVLPFVKLTAYETRRLAELISQLPAEVRQGRGSLGMRGPADRACSAQSTRCSLMSMPCS